MSNLPRQTQQEETLAATVRRQRLITTAIVAAAFAAFIIPLAYINVSHFRYVDSDTASSPRLKGVGFVSHVRNVRSRHMSEWMMRIEMDGLRSPDISVRTRLKIGQRVSLRYRIGKSGTLYVEKVIPIETRN